MADFQVRTDLALEANEHASKEEGKLKGIIVNEDYDKELDVMVTTLEVLNEEGAEAIKKPIGNYITIEAQNMVCTDEEYHRKIAEFTSTYIARLMEPHRNKKGKVTSILVVGLGNRDVTPDSLGPVVVENISIDRHLGMQQDDQSEEEDIVLSGLIPGVMAQTGMETSDIIKGIVQETNPDIVIAIDALAARSSKRLNTTIQITDKGIHPGSGVGNHRVGITKETIGVPVIAVGVPTVIDAPTIVNDTMENFMRALSFSKELKGMADIYSEYTQNEKYSLIKEVINPQMADMYVTPKDVDATIRRIGYTISDAINLASGKFNF